MQKKLKSLLFAFVFLAFLSGSISCGFSDSAALDNGKIFLTGENKTKIEAIVDKYMAKTGSPAALLGVWAPDGEMILVKGKSDLKAGTDAKATDRFRIASVTKTFTATLLLMLADRKSLNLDDKLSKFYPGFKNADKISIRQLLNHTSGIPSYTAMNEFDKYVKPEPLKKWTNEELLKMVENATPDFEPGTGFKYSNSNYLLAGLIIEKVSGNSYADELKTKICAPLGLKDTYYAVTPEIEGPHFHGYEDTVDVSLFDPSGPGFAGAIVSTLADLKIWAEAFVEGRLISARLREESVKFIVEDGYPQSGYGLGMMAWGSFHGHSGMIKGGCVVMFRDPDAKVTIICMYPMTADYLKLATEYTFNETADLLIPGSYMKSVKAYSVIKK